MLSDRELDGWLTVAAECEWFDDDQDKETAGRLYADLVFAEDSPLRLYLALDHGKTRDRTVPRRHTFA